MTIIWPIFGKLSYIERSTLKLNTYQLYDVYIFLNHFFKPIDFQTRHRSYHYYTESNTANIYRPLDCTLANIGSSSNLDVKRGRIYAFRTRNSFSEKIEKMRLKKKLFCMSYMLMWVCNSNWQFHCGKKRFFSILYLEF